MLESRTAAVVVSRLNRHQCDDRTHGGTRAALIAKRRWHEIRITRVNRRAARHREMRECWSTIILQQTKQRIRVDLIARTGHNAATVIAADVISVRRNGAAIVDDVFSECAGVEDCIGKLSIAAVVDATARRGRVAADCAVDDCDTAPRAFELPAADTATEGNPSLPNYRSMCC